jgi:hypothetical protein
MLKPEVTVNFTLFPRKKKATDPQPKLESDVDYIAAAKAAARDLGKELFIGLGAVALATVGAATVGAIAVVATHHTLNK